MPRSVHHSAGPGCRFAQTPRGSSGPSERVISLNAKHSVEGEKCVGPLDKGEGKTRMLPSVCGHRAGPGTSHPREQNRSRPVAVRGPSPALPTGHACLAWRPTAPGAPPSSLGVSEPQRPSRALESAFYPGVTGVSERAFPVGCLSDSRVEPASPVGRQHWRHCPSGTSFPCSPGSQGPRLQVTSKCI